MSQRGRWLVAIIAVLTGALLGRIMAHERGGPFTTPAPIDASAWQIISPGLEAGILHPGRGSHRVDGALVITDHLFFGADRLVPQINGLATELEVELAPESGPLEVLMGQPPLGMHQIHPDVHGHRVALQIRQGALILSAAGAEQNLGSVTPERLEFSAVQGSARIQQIKVRDANGSVLMHRDYRDMGIATQTLNRGTLMGALLGLVLAAVMAPLTRIRALVVGVLLLLPPALVVGCPPDFWLPCLERLYLVDWSPSELAQVALLIALIPAVMAAVSALCRAPWSSSGVAPRALLLVWWAMVLVALIVRMTPSVWMVGALLWALMPLWLVRKDPDSARTWLALDLVALSGVIAMGWGAGLLMGTLWRMAVLVGGAHVLAQRAPRPAMDSLFLMLIALLPATESTLRHTTLQTTWDPTQLQEERPSERGWRDPLESWSGRCGPKSPEKTVRVLVAGGSSAGGAYQFKDDPEASFVAQTHLNLCENLPPNTALETHNFGRGNRDTFTISRTIDAMLEKSQADVVLLYVGVNDLLADQYPMSRKQREDARQARHSALQGAAGLARRLRMVTGIWLATRTLPDKSAPSVPDVPLPDAQENFEMIADAAQAQGAHLWLMTEHMRAEQYGRLSAYREVQKAVASARTDVGFIDVRSAFEGATDEAMLVDQNHLTREGAARLGVLLANHLQGRVFAQGSSL